MGRQDIAVAKGARWPLIKPAAFASEIHGEYWIRWSKVPSTPSRQAVAMPASDVIINKVMTSDTPVTIVATGPLTNVATALIREPRIAEHIESITLMGGGTFVEIGRLQQLDIWVDAEAAKRVFESGITINVFGLDVTHQVLADDHVIERFESINNSVAHNSWSNYCNSLRRHTRLTLIWTVVQYMMLVQFLYLLQPELFTMVPVNIDIEHQSPLTYGTMAVDLNHVTGKPANAYFATAVDVEEVWNLIDHKLRTYE